MLVSCDHHQVFVRLPLLFMVDDINYLWSMTPIFCFCFFFKRKKILRARSICRVTLSLQNTWRSLKNLRKLFLFPVFFFKIDYLCLISCEVEEQEIHVPPLLVFFQNGFLFLSYLSFSGISRSKKLIIFLQISIDQTANTIIYWTQRTLIPYTE